MRATSKRSMLRTTASRCFTAQRCVGARWCSGSSSPARGDDAWQRNAMNTGTPPTVLACGYRTLVGDGVWCWLAALLALLHPTQSHHVWGFRDGEVCACMSSSAWFEQATIITATTSTGSSTASPLHPSQRSRMHLVHRRSHRPSRSSRCVCETGRSAQGEVIGGD